MKVDVYIVNSFTLEGKGGNPAGIVYDWQSQLGEKEMQEIAQRMGLSETAFVRTGSLDADFDLRFFTPTDEVPLCGHATIASFWLMSLQERLSKVNLLQKTSAGILNISINQTPDKTYVWMTQSIPKQIKTNMPFNHDFLTAFPNAEIDPRLPIEIWSTGLNDILLPIKTREDLNNLETNMDAISAISKDHDVVGVHAFVSSSDSQVIYARNFAPLYGIDEESATGTSNGALTAYLAHHYNFKQRLDNISAFPYTVEYEVLQGEVMANPSLIYTKLDYLATDNEPTIWVGGTCSLMEIKEIHI